MKFFIVGALSLLSFGAWANSGASCDLRITENKVSCPWVGFCPEKVLRESKMNLTEMLSEGQVVNGELVLNKVVLTPGTENEGKHSIYQLPGDNRASKLVEEKKIDLVEFVSKTEIQYTMSSVGDTINLSFTNRNSTYRIRMEGDFRGKVDGWIHLGVLDAKGNRATMPLYITCSKTNEQAINESELQKEAVAKFLEEKKKKQEQAAIQQ